MRVNSVKLQHTSAASIRKAHFVVEITVKDGLSIAKKLDTVQRPGSRHDIVKVRVAGKIEYSYNLSRGHSKRSAPYIPKQIGLDVREAHDLAVCRMSREQYEEMSIARLADEHGIDRDVL